MQLLLICETFPPEVDAKASRFSEFMPLWQAQGIAVTCLTRAPNFPKGILYEGYTNPWRSESAWHGARIVRLWSYLAPNAGFLKRVLGFGSFMLSSIWCGARLRHVDVVLATSPSLFAAMGGYVIARLLRKPFVFEVRDLWPEAIMAVGAMRENFLIRILKKIAGHMYRHAAHIVAVGEGYKQQIVDWYGIAPEKITVIPNGILPQQFSPQLSKQQARAQLGLKPDATYVMYMGTHGHAHRLDVVQDAAQLLQDLPHVEFLFVGEGVEKEALKKRAAEKGLQARCHFIDQQRKESVPVWYDAVDIALVLLKKAPLFEGTVPSKTYEAMAMQKPVICNVPGTCAEMIAAAACGTSIAPEDAQAMASAIRKMLASPEAMQRMGEAGRAHVMAHYQRSVLAENYAVLLQRLALGK